MSNRRPRLRLFPSSPSWDSRLFSGAAFLDIAAGTPQGARTATWPSTNGNLTWTGHEEDCRAAEPRLNRRLSPSTPDDEEDWHRRSVWGSRRVLMEKGDDTVKGIDGNRTSYLSTLRVNHCEAITSVPDCPGIMVKAHLTSVRRHDKGSSGIWI
jgi:hypothetical protein